jgi:cell division protein DivIC
MNKLLRVVTNKFVITGAAFLVWMIFFDQNNWSSQQARNQQLESTEANIDWLNKEIATMEKEHDALINDPAYLERFAREQYKMKRDNEDVYIVEK